ncbi:hypothetical protein PFISCL1PPCAC_8246, partial [Pristionchus fissidentatus]
PRPPSSVNSPCRNSYFSSTLRKLSSPVRSSARKHALASSRSRMRKRTSICTRSSVLPTSFSAFARLSDTSSLESPSLSSSSSTRTSRCPSLASTTS